MTPEPYEALTSRRRRRLAAGAALRVAATIAVLGTLYYVLPLNRGPM